MNCMVFEITSRSTTVCSSLQQRKIKVLHYLPFVIETNGDWAIMWKVFPCNDIITGWGTEWKIAVVCELSCFQLRPQMMTICKISQYSDVIMTAMVSQITSVSIVYSSLCSGADQREHQSSASLAFVRGFHRWPVNSPCKGPVTRKMFPFDDVIMSVAIGDQGLINGDDPLACCLKVLPARPDPYGLPPALDLLMGL